VAPQKNCESFTINKSAFDEGNWRDGGTAETPEYAWSLN